MHRLNLQNFILNLKVPELKKSLIVTQIDIQKLEKAIKSTEDVNRS